MGGLGGMGGWVDGWMTGWVGGFCHVAGVSVAFGNYAHTYPHAC